MKHLVHRSTEFGASLVAVILLCGPAAPFGPIAAQTVPPSQRGDPAMERMGMHNAAHIGSAFIRFKMHPHFRSWREITIRGRGRSDPLAVHIDDDHLIDCHQAFAQSTRCGQDTSIVEPRRDIAIGGDDQASIIEQFADAHDFFAQLPFGLVIRDGVLGVGKWWHER